MSKIGMTAVEKIRGFLKQKEVQINKSAEYQAGSLPIVQSAI